MRMFYKTVNGAQHKSMLVCAIIAMAGNILVEGSFRRFTKQ